MLWVSGPEITSIQLCQQHDSPAPTLARSSASCRDLISRQLFALLPVPIYLFSLFALDSKDEWFSYYGTGDSHTCNDDAVVSICTCLFAVCPLYLCCIVSLQPTMLLRNLCRGRTINILRVLSPQHESRVLVLGEMLWFWFIEDFWSIK